MANRNKDVRLRNGVKVPILGLGKLANLKCALSLVLLLIGLCLGTTHSGGYVHDTVVYAIKECGYRHLDTAKRYGVEKFLGQAIKDSGVAREEMFLTTKLWPKDYGFDKSRGAAFESMKRLGTDYLDVFMLHFPTCPSDVANPQQVIEETWRQLELLLDEGRIRALGVSNFLEEDLERLMTSMETSGSLPHVNQCEFHPYQNPRNLRRFCDENEIQFQGFCPLAKGKLLYEEPIVKIAHDVGKSPAQVLIRWSIQNNVLTIPKSTKRERVRENFQALEFQLPDETMAALDEISTRWRIIELDNVRQKLDNDLPDGYKMKKFHCVLP